MQCPHANLLRQAFATLRRMQADEFDEYPEDHKRQILIENDDVFRCKNQIFTELFEGLKKEACGYLRRRHPHILESHRNMNFKMRMLRYEPTATTISGKPHTDYGTISIVFADEPGLQVRVGDKWVDAEASETVPFILNGRSLSDTFGIDIPPTAHRVVNGQVPRHAIVLFVEADDSYEDDFSKHTTLQACVARRQDIRNALS